MAKHTGNCPKCGARVDHEPAAGGVLVCPGCQARLRVPRPRESAFTHPGPDADPVPDAG